MFVAIRSGKHSNSTDATHTIDFEKLINNDDFADPHKTDNRHVKPVIIQTVDGGPDENPRYENVVITSFSNFQPQILSNFTINPASSILQGGTLTRSTLTHITFKT